MFDNLLDMVFGFNIRLRRLQFFLAGIALGIVSVLLIIPIALYVHHVSITDGTPASLSSAGWVWIVFLGFYLVSSLMLASMRVRDIGWDPVIVIPAWAALRFIDPVLASYAPGLSFGPEHHGTIIGALINFGLGLILMVWPSGDRIAAPPRVDSRAPPPPRAVPNSASVLSERIAKTTGFGRRV